MAIRSLGGWLLSGPVVGSPKFVVGIAETVEGRRFATSVTDVSPDDQGLPQAVDSVVELTEIALGCGFSSIRWRPEKKGPALAVAVDGEELERSPAAHCSAGERLYWFLFIVGASRALVDCVKLLEFGVEIFEVGVFGAQVVIEVFVDLIEEV